MRKRLVAIYSVLVVAIVLFAVLVPGCAPKEQGLIEVKATLCGNPWEGAVNYTLTPATGSAINGTSVFDTFSVTAGTWTCGNVSGGPPGAYLDSITPLPTQEVSANGKITFTLNFELEQDASIEFVTWTINGVPIEEYGNAWYEGGKWHVVMFEYCGVIGVEYTQHVAGCPGYEVEVKETSELSINYTYGNYKVHVSVANNACAVVKEPEPIEKVSQVPSFNREPAQPGEKFELPRDQAQILDVETVWLLEKGVTYTKSINWLGISEVAGQHECILFDLLVPYKFMQDFFFELVSSAEVELVGGEDVNPGNNKAVSPEPLVLDVVIP